jgi:hypothetical protein
MIELFSKTPKWDRNIGSISKKTFVKASKVDQELECEV